MKMPINKLNNNRNLLITSLSTLMFAMAATPAFAQGSGPVLEIENFLSDKGNVWRIDGQEKLNVSSCRSNNSRVELSFGSWSWLGRSGGYKNLNEYPHLKITLPSNAALKISDSIIFGDSQDLGSADISLNHCSDLVFESISKYLNLNIAGSGDFTAKDIGSADIAIKGSGDVVLDDVGDLSLSISGSGDFNAETVRGVAALRVHGSGDIEIDDIRGSLNYKSQGSGDLSIDEITAETAQISVNGSGGVEIDTGDIKEMTVSTNGSGDVSYRGHAGDVEARANGSSDVYIRKTSGEVWANVNGSAGVKINGVRYHRD